MKRLLRIATGRPDASASALRAAAAAAPTVSGVAFVDNSQGASQAAAELSAALGTALDQIDFEGTLDETLRRFVHRLDEVASEYDNSRLRDGGAGQAPWECTQHTAQLVSIAWACALDTYSMTTTTTGVLAEADTAAYRFERDWVGAPSVGGTVKTLTSTVVSPLADAVDNDNALLPVLVIAVRGTVTKVDHMVNANGRPVDAAAFVGTHYGTELRAHAGFLNSADALDDTALARISSYVRAQKARGAKAHVLFAGHSAGGAVASLLYLRYRGRQEFESTARFSCITFGAPPAVSLPLTAVGSSGCGTDGDSNDPICLSLINEFDLVSRADTPYVVSVAGLFRAAQQNSLPRSEDKPVVLDVVVEVEQEHENEGSDEKTWPLPRALFHHVGHVIVLAMRLEGDGDGDNDGGGAGAVGLRAVRVDHGVLERLLFCRVAVHRRACYAERARLLARGEFNGLKV
ncbi:Alpha/Beta hydrolase protein [Lasiosphaeria ovina]|uniref:Alpha/Beta hydrolase protein n=1 Tax=Lasiosphaeria ovina TaxID=92902 RepID=A0AAE0JTR7_9PEZI|nr:Alpha/Beta hydrolase protein [Lasiosphaeria ovina]